MVPVEQEGMEEGTWFLSLSDLGSSAEFIQSELKANPVPLIRRVSATIGRSGLEVFSPSPIVFPYEGITRIEYGLFLFFMS